MKCFTIKPETLCVHYLLSVDFDPPKMDLEACVIDRLGKLRQWQIEQQEHLLKQQQIQREILSQKQDCMYKALELSLQELDLNDTEVSQNCLPASYAISNSSFATTDNEESSAEQVIYDQDSNHLKEHTSQDISDIKNEISGLVKSVILQLPKSTVSDISNCDDTETTPQKSAVNRNPQPLYERQHKQVNNNFFMEGVAPLPSEKLSVKSICIDDMPVPSPKKDFHVLLEEKLKDSDNDVHAETGADTKTKVKKPFLRKGQGLSRYRANQDDPSRKSSMRSRSASLSANTRLNSKSNKTQDNKLGKSACTQNKARKSISNMAVPQNQLSLKNVPLPRKKIRSKSESSSVCTDEYASPNGQKGTEHSSPSDFHKKSQKELEEVRIFELLEEKAENSSFCSTSSAVVAFLQQSTPFKIRKTVSGIEHSSINIKQQTSPIIKSSLIQHRFNKINTYIPCSQSGSVDLEPGRGKSTYLTTCSETTECSERIINSENVHSAQDSAQQPYNYDSHTPRKDNDVDVSLHVRFSEYNEYKTIGLTDTSTISNESSDVQGFVDDKSWDDTLTSNGFDTDTSYSMEQQSQLPVITHNNVLKGIKTAFHEKCSMSNGTTHMSSRSALQYDNNDDFESLYHNEEDLQSMDATTETSDDEHRIEEKSNNKLPPAVFSDHKTHCKVPAERSNNNNTGLKPTTHDNANNVAIQTSEDNNPNFDEPVFKSELLKTRLLELEKEIDIFRKENIALSKQRQKLQEDREKFCRESTEIKKQLEEGRRQAENQLLEEKKKITRERNALENRMRDAQEKAQQSKLERQEMQSLKEELEELREELALKESRWNAAQSRHKCQVRILKMENSKLKQDLEKLQNSKKANTKTRGKVMKETNTKTMHQINKQLNMQNKENFKNINEPLLNNEDKITSPIMQAMTKEKYDEHSENLASNCGRNQEQSRLDDANKCDIYEMLNRPEQKIENIAKKRTLYQNLLKEATIDLTEPKEISNKSLEDPPAQSIQVNTNRESRANSTEVENQCLNRQKNDDNTLNHPFHNVQDQKLDISEEMHQQSTPPVEMGQQDDMKGPSSSSEHSHNHSYQNNSTKQQDVRQVHHHDGRIEYWYPNGNVKKVYPDLGIAKMIYYNGDVRETSKDGKIRYYYASTRTWHTTMPDGLEILEFQDGQVERRLHDGTVEVAFPDGSVRLVQPDGSEKWALTDGSIVETLVNGEKILTLPNGQREIHTESHKRREYPDGTVKLLYPDGTQETRYSNGRTRLKDKDGNLLMDSFQ